MRLINVKTFLDIETSIKQGVFSKSKVDFLELHDDATTAYAILSHRWGKEVNYSEMVKLLKMNEEDRNELRQRDGYRKICDSCERAAKDGFQWLWADTCCIDKRSSAELSEAINSMYRWYENSTKCYVYLHDVDGLFPSEPDDKSFPKFNGWPEWFSRGWTLQELIAPKDVEFYNKGWVPIGTKRQHTEVLSMITRVPRNVLIYGLSSHRPCVAQIMSWAADRTTTRVEDRAYSLLGLFDVHMPMLYGEGKGAFQRLQLEIIRILNDHSIFAWDPERKSRRAGSVLAEDPGCFRDCHDVKKMSSRAFMTGLRRQFMPEGVETPDAEDEQLNVFSVTNGGIRIWLPSTPYRNHPSVCRVALACSLNGDPVPITIDLVYADEESNYSRYGGVRETLCPLPGFKFQKLYLSYRDDVQRGSILLDDRTIFYYGFKRCGSYPRQVANNSISLPSLTHDPVVVVYANDNVRIRFAVGFEDRMGREPVQVFWDEPYVAGKTWPTWEAYAEGVYHQMRGARSRTRSVPKLSEGESSDDPDSNSSDSFIKHVHLPRSICAAKIILSRRDSGNHTVTVDIDQCTGCCHSPLEWKTLGNTINELDLPGLMAKLHTSFTRDLYMDGIRVQFRECCFRTALGDYGEFVADAFNRCGNIFEDLQALATFDPADPAFRPVEHKISGVEFTKESDVTNTANMVLRRPVGLSLPNTRHVVSLLKALSARLKNKCLVVAVLQCAPDPWNPMLNGHQGRPISTFCSFARPQVWNPDGYDERRRREFAEIRKQFSVLSGLVRIPPTGDQPTESREEAIRFFYDLYGLEHLKTYLGDVTFFERVSVDFYDEAPPQELDIEVTAKPLLKRIRTYNWVLGLSGKRKTESEAESISRSLGVGLLEKIGTAYINDRSSNDISVSPQQSHRKDSGRTKRDVDYDKPASIPSVLQEIQVLQEILDAVEEDDERRALEEDITGKILWVCWRGICSEVQHVPAKVVDYILNEKLGDTDDVRTRTQCLTNIGMMFRNAFTGSGRHRLQQIHLWRVIDDAWSGTSKYQLLLDAKSQSMLQMRAVLRTGSVTLPN